MREGERVAVLNGAGTELMCEVAAVDKKAVRLKVQQQNDIAQLPYRITLLQAMTKGKSMDFIIQKATELCVHRIVPLAAGRSVVQVDDAESKLEKWNAIAIDSIKQCGSPWLPVIEKPVTPKEFLARNESFDCLWLRPSKPHQASARVCGWLQCRAWSVAGKHCDLGGAGRRFHAGRSERHSFQWRAPHHLGQVILRSETAALYTISALNYEMQSPRG